MAARDAHIRTLHIALVALFLLASGMGFGWYSAPRQLTVYLPPDLRAASQRPWWEVPPATVYAFAFSVFQQINRWPTNGEADYPRNLSALRAYLTPGCYNQIDREFHQRQQNGELRDRVPESRRNRLWEMGEAMNMFCSGFEGELFNREGEAWPEADLTLVDLAMFAREGYEAQLAIAYISLINHINNLGERDQHLARPIVNITDEAHIITVNSLLARFLTKGSKMWRKLGIWLWLATQNLSDFPDDAKKLLNMIEWWELLVMPPEEVEQVSRFKSLTPEQRQLLLSATKAPGKYTEGVVLSPRVEALFRVVSPALWLALGMTEKHEKAERMRIMREFGCSEPEAAIRVAEAHFVISNVTA
ncbi:TIGR03746 family integrating conjugative element protein [Salmonella enterica subsp. enterica]|nr:TIGR03746 family integrating conjugative element protein [Salmonella enterica subsp. enterica]